MGYPRNIVGPPVEGDDCYGRGEDTVRLWNAVQLQNLLLSGPRRLGKTSLLKHFANHARTNGARVVYVDVSGATDELGLIERLLRELRSLEGAGVPKTVSKRVTRALAGLESLKVSIVELKQRADGRPPWRQGADELEEILNALGRSRSPWFLLVDELPVLLKHLSEDDATGQRVERLLSWCRELRQTAGGAARVRWVFCGSIGLSAMTNRLGLTHTINDLTHHPVAPFDRSTARGFLSALCASEAMASDHALIEAMLDRTRWFIPHHLQILFSEVRALPHLQDPITRVAAAFETALTKRSYYEHWYERLDDELTATDARHARVMLEAVARDPEGVRFSTLSGCIADEVDDPRARQETVLRLANSLADDGYIEREGERWRFRSELLRAFWRARYVP